MLKKQKSKQLLKKLVRRPAKALILAGLFLFVIASGIKIIDSWQEASLWLKRDKKAHEAKRLIIPKIGVDLPITPGGVVNQQWLLADDSVLVLPTSGKPDEGFNTVLYGHNRPGLLANLNKLALDDEVLVENEVGTKFVYRVYSLEEARPEELIKIKSETPNIITLFTCEGFFDQARLIVRAKLSLQK